jgi:hypothetical protein
MFSFIPVQYRLLALAIALTVAAAAIASVAWTVSRTYADAHYSPLLAEKDREIAELKLAIEKQNSAVDVMKAKTAAADIARQKAEQHAKEVTEISKKRVKQVDAIPAVSCRKMLEDLKAGSK